MRPIGIIFFLVAIVFSLLSSCTNSSDSCDDLVGYLTHSEIELLGIESARVWRRDPDSGALESVDQLNSTEFSNLVISVELSWIEEQHRFRAPNTFIQSFLDFFISTASACSLVPYYEEYQPMVTGIEIYSESDLNSELVAGSDLSWIFTSPDGTSEMETLFEAAENNNVLSARSYSLAPARLNGELVAIPEVPRTHLFTVFVRLDDGRVYEIRTPEFQVSGV